MIDELIKVAATQGVWTLLSCILIFYILKNQEQRDQKQEERENNYQNIIQTLTKKLDILDEISSDIDSIKNKLN